MLDNAKKIKKLSQSAMQEAKAYIDKLSKPLGSLGLMEEYAIKLAGIRGYMGCPVDKYGVLVFAADNGVHEEDITPVPQAVTLTQAENIAKNVSGVSAFASLLNCDVKVFDIGMKTTSGNSAIADIKIKNGTDNIANGPAMTREECVKAIEAGFKAAVDNAEYDILGVGEMGICNTTTAAAILSVLANLPVKEVTGRGAGIDDEMLAKKIATIKKAITTNKPDKNDVIDVIAKVGGLDIAAMAGAFLGAAFTSTPVVIDGFISAVAALCASRINELAADYMFASHKSAEPGYSKAIDMLGLKPALDLGMRLGEGSGCPLMFNILNASLVMVDNMATLDTVGLSAKALVDIR